MSPRPIRAAAAALAAGTAFALAGCVPNAPAEGGNAVAVTSTDTACEVSVAEAVSGTVTFTVTNAGTKVTEFYVLAEDELRIVGEVENIAPQLERTLTIVAQPGTYYTLCKPGMTGAGIGRSVFTVTGEAVELTGDLAEQVATANANYQSYVKEQVSQLLAGTEEFVAAYLTGDDDAARALYAPTRQYWERIETVAGSFSDLDEATDFRQGDFEDEDDWTGWHKLEKDLWPERAVDYTPLTHEQREFYAGKLLDDIVDLNGRVQTLEFSLDDLANGAIGLLDEVAEGKITGEEEYWSRTDLWDFQANVDGAKVLYGNVRDILLEKDAELAATLDDEFAALQSLLDAQRDGEGFVLYSDLTPDEISALAEAVASLSEPLSRLTSVLVG